MEPLAGGSWQYAMKKHEREEHERGKHHRDPETGELVVPIDRPHVHRETLKSRYLLTPGSLEGKRLDANPLTIAEGWRDRGLAVFCLEGALKNDAIVSAGWPCFNVPSVTMWNIFDPGEDNFDPDEREGHELVEFARRELAGVPIVVVCDSDWHHNPQVLSQTRMATALLMSVTDAPVTAAAPPEGELLPSGRRKKLGVDDHLGNSEEFGPPQDFLELRTRDVFEQGLVELRSRLLRRSGQSRKVVNGMVRLVAALQNVATEDGRAEFAPRALAPQIGDVSESTLKRHHKFNLEARVYLQGRPARRRGIGDGKFYTQAPEIQLPEPLHPRVAQPTLRDWLDRIG
jgi:hypothetical protein